MTGATEVTGVGDRTAEVRRFFQAIRDRDHERLRELGRADPSLLSEFDPDGCCGGTVMNLAVCYGDTELLATLLDLGADPNQPSDWPPGPFRALDSIPDSHLDALGPWLIERGAALDAHAAAKLGMLDALQLLVESDPDVVRRKGPDGQRPLHVARTPEIAAYLLDKGSDIETRCVDHGSTPAEYAATSRPDVCRFLLDRGARGDPFMYAMIGDLDRLAAEIEADPEALHIRVTPDRFTPTTEEAAHIYMYTIGQGSTLLHAAANRGRVEIVRFLIERGLDPDVRGGYDDQTPAHGAAWENEADVIRALAEGGADLNLPSGRIHKNPPLGWAIVGGSADVAEALVEAGVEIRDHYAEDAARGEAGEFRTYSSATPEAYARIRKILESARA